MGIIWKPIGTLDINTSPTDLPEQSDGRTIISGAMTRCKNLRLDRNGMAMTRHGSSLIANFVSTNVPELILDVGGNRYIFAGNDIFYNEELVVEAFSCVEPVFDPPGGSYLSPQSVTITCETEFAVIYYTIDGSIPTVSGNRYFSPVTVPSGAYLKAVAIDPRGFLSDSGITSEYYYVWAQNSFITETNSDTFVTETNADTLTIEGP